MHQATRRAPSDPDHLRLPSPDCLTVLSNLLTRLRRRSTNRPSPRTHDHSSGANWDYVPAFRSGGVLLVCMLEQRLGADEETIAFAPPGVAIDDSPRDQLSHWRRAAWREASDVLRGGPAASLRRVEVSEVLDMVPADFKDWVLSATRQQIDGLRWFVDTAPDDGCADPYEREAATSANRLEVELQTAAERQSRLHSGAAAGL